MKNLSIITTAYKSEKYLNTYFENITNLDGFADYEIILILNQPNKKEIEISEYYKKKFPNNIRVERVSLENLATSTNRGFLLANSEYITCADVDDQRVANAFTRQIQTLEKDEKASYTYGDFIMVNQQGENKGLYIKTIDFNKEEAIRSSIVGPNHFFRKNILEKCGYWDEQFKSSADFDFQIRATFNFNFKKTNGKSLLYYTRYQGSDSASSNELQQIERTVIQLRYGIYDKINYKFLPRALEYDIYHVYYNGQKKYIGDLVPNYKEFIDQRYKLYFKKGIIKNFINPDILDQVKFGFKYLLKDPIWIFQKFIKKMKK